MAVLELLGRDYILHERIGQGPVAVVRRATRPGGGPPFAARLLLPGPAGNQDVRDQFRQAAPTLCGLRHESIVGVHDLVFEPAQLIMITDYVGGSDLRFVVAARGGRLPLAEVDAVAAQLAGALATAHAHRVAHLDLRPEHILVGRDAPIRIKVSDFGVAGLLLDAGLDLRSIGAITPYTAPEVRAGEMPAAASDVFAFGLIVAELATGVRPDPGTVPDLPDGLRALVGECLAADPGDRPSASTLAALANARGDTVEWTESHLESALPAWTAQAAEAPVAEAKTTAGWAGPSAWASPPARASLPAHGGSPAQSHGLPGKAGPGGRPPGGPPPAAGRSPGGRRRWGPLVTLVAGVTVAMVLGALSANATSEQVNRRPAAAQPALEVTSPSTTAVPGRGAGEAPPAPAAAATPPSPKPKPAAPPKVDRFRAAYAGNVKDGSASVAIAIRDGGAIAYLCDGNRVEAWLLGTAKGGNLNLSGPRGSMTGTYDKDSAGGLITAAGRTWTLDIRLANKPSGLYRSTVQIRGARVVSGWIVLNNGRQVGMVNTAGVSAPAPTLDVNSGAATVNGTPVTAMPLDGESANGFPQ